MLRDVIDIRNGAETLTLSRFRAIPESRGQPGVRNGAFRALRGALGEPRAMAELRAFLSLHAFLPFGQVLTDHEVLTIAETAIACGALGARLSIDERHFRPIGDPRPERSSPPSPAPSPLSPIVSPPSQAAEKEFPNESAQAATHRKASKDGKPFCEICEKMKAERAKAAA
jgi:hypothetical protein